ncbi:hypothetical protein [Shewanella zhangzhouensis]|uniref:hypothetical protein n=1 Tax=Shewanella zhangzhouensis TaxID=2864213 RepID=UPI001C65AAFE|nr:hypothetical protein [Shewanella zhangzhouensis]QYK05834.1 hypothetical protein K0H63_03045 [Shewanella zhangzhouensis]
MSLLHEEQKNRPQWLLIISGVFLLVILVSAGWYAITKKKFDKLTLCELDAPSQVVAILIDKTGGFNQNQQRLVSRAIIKEIDELSVGYRVAIYEVDPATFNGLSTAVFDKCKPRDGSDANQFFENKLMLEKKFKQSFKSPVEDITEAATQSLDASRSPILESLTDLATIYSLESDQKLARIVLITDLIQHTDAISFYRTHLSAIPPKSQVSRLPDLFGVEVQLYWLLREGNEKRIQDSGLISWWEQAFNLTSTSDFKVIKVR